MDREVLALLHENEQDEAQCLDWLRKSSPASIGKVWDVIVRHYDDDAMEVMSRFAQYGMTQAILRLQQGDNDGD